MIALLALVIQLSLTSWHITDEARMNRKLKWNKLHHQQNKFTQVTKFCLINKSYKTNLVQNTNNVFFKKLSWNFLIKLKIVFSSASIYVNNKLPPIFNSWFIFFSTFHNYETSFAAKGHLKILTVATTTYGKGAFISMATKTWNNTQSQIKDPMLNTFSPNKLKIFLFDFYLNLYQTQDFIASSGI